MGLVAVGEQDPGRGEAPWGDIHGVRRPVGADDMATVGIEPLSLADRRSRKPVVQRMSDSLAATIGGAVTAVLVFLFS